MRYKITMIMEDNGDYDSMIDQLMAIGGEDIETEEEAPSPPHVGGGPKRPKRLRSVDDPTLGPFPNHEEN